MMTESEFRWKQYYEESNPERRKELLESNFDPTADDDDTLLRRKLWSLRYTDPSDPERRVDMFLWQCVNLLCLYKTSGFLFFHKSSLRELQKAREAMGFDLAEEFGESGKRILYMEFRNTIRRYFGTCSDRSFRKKTFGVMTMDENEWQDKIAGNAWQLSVGLPKRFDMKEELAPFSSAVHDEYFALYPQGEVRWLKFENRQEKRAPDAYA